MYDLRVIVAVVVIHQLNIRTCMAQNCSQTSLQRFDDAVITFIRQEKCPNIELVSHFSNLNCMPRVKN